MLIHIWELNKYLKGGIIQLEIYVLNLVLANVSVFNFFLLTSVEMKMAHRSLFVAGKF